jgi:hypothetical protein
VDKLIGTIPAPLSEIWRVERLPLLATDRDRGFSSSLSGCRAASAWTLFARCKKERLVREPLAQEAASPGIAQGSRKPVDTQVVPGSLTWVEEVWWKGEGSGEFAAVAAGNRERSQGGGQAKSAREECTAKKELPAAKGSNTNFQDTHDLLHSRSRSHSHSRSHSFARHNTRQPRLPTLTTPARVEFLSRRLLLLLRSH